MKFKNHFHYVLIFTILVFGFFSCHLEKNKKTFFYHIKGELLNENIDSVFLYKAGSYLGYTYEKMGSVKVESGQFRFDGEFSHAEMYYIGIGNQQHIPFFLSTDEILVKEGLKKPTEYIITGASLNEKLQEFESSLKMVENRQQELEMIDAFIQSQPDSPLNPYLILNYRYHIGNFEELNHLYNLMDLSLRTHPYSSKIRSQMDILELVQQGKLAPEIISKDSARNEKRLSSLRGSYVLIEFWASWCGTCRAENATLVKLYRELKSKDTNFEIFAVAAEFEKLPWTSAIVEDKLPWISTSLINGFDEQAFADYGIKSIPASILINPEGRIIARGLEGEELRNKILEILQ